MSSLSTLIHKHPATKHLKKHVHWYWLFIYLAFFLGIPLLAVILSSPSSYYLRIIQEAGLFMFTAGFSLYGMLASKEAFFRKKRVEFTTKHEVAIVVVRILYVGWFVASVYFLAPILGGIFQKFVLNKPYEIIDDTVIYAYSSGGRYSHSYGNCRFMYCQLKLQGNPSREFEYDDAPYIEQGLKYEFIILPGSNLIVGSQ